MWRIKRIFAVLLCVACLSGCATEKKADVDLINTKVTTNYKLTEVKEGSFKRMEKSVGNPVYTKTEYLICEFEDAVLKENLHVKLNSRVKKGDILATFVQETSDTELKRLELEYQRAMDEKDNGIAQHYSRIASISGNDSIAYMQRVQAENDLALFKMSADKKCQAALERLEEYRQRYEEKYIIAPFDGKISWTETLKAGDKVTEGHAVIQIYDPSEFCVRIGNPSEGFMKMTVPGTPVTITFLKKTHNGTVVSTPNGVREAKGNSIYVVFENTPEEVEVGSMTVECSALELDNMLMLDKDAIRTDDTADYVMILEDDVVSKRYVVCGPENDEVVCILDGVTAGQQVVLN